MFFYLEIIRVYVNININFDLINVARNKCDDLNLKIINFFKIFRLEEKCVKIINFLKNKMN